MKYFIANWKANKTFNEVSRWIDVFLHNYQPKDKVKIVICPPYPFIIPLREKLKNNDNINLGAQDISQFEKGSFTGEVTAMMLSDLIDYVIIGHSERRQYFLEDEKIIERKINQAIKYKIEPILCVRNEKDKIYPGVKMIAYEPVYAIGTGYNEPKDKVIKLKKLLSLPKNAIFLYGGSVNENNSADYLSKEIDGLLIGNASLDPNQLIKIINHLLENQRK